MSTIASAALRAVRRVASRSSQRAPRAARNDPPLEYLIVVPVRFHRLTRGSVAVESAFCEHLRALRAQLSPAFARLTIAAPTMEPAHYERDRGHLGCIDEQREGLRWVALYPGSAGRGAFWLRHSLAVFRSLWREVRRADLVHAGTSHDVYRPCEFAALLLAKLWGKQSVCVVDIDLREEARMNHRTGRLGRKSLILCRSVYDPLRSLQLRCAARWCSLVLLKGRRLCRDYGRGRAHVKYFLDAAFSDQHVISPLSFAQKVSALEDPAQPLELVYFGRLAAYKGVDRCIEAVASAAARTTAPLRLSIIGAGEDAERLRRLCAQLEVEHLVRFRPAVPYGPRLFEQLRELHLMLAAPLSEDTPRSALDALACGLPILAFATEYYTDLATSGAVELVPWPSVERLAERIARYAQHKQSLVPRALAGIEFARANTQETWLRARARWTLALFGTRAESTGSEGVDDTWRPVGRT